LIFIPKKSLVKKNTNPSYEKFVLFVSGDPYSHRTHPREGTEHQSPKSEKRAAKLSFFFNLGADMGSNTRAASYGEFSNWKKLAFNRDTSYSGLLALN
jgi:hypothetical protein